MDDYDDPSEHRDFTSLRFSHAEEPYEAFELEDNDRAIEDRDYINQLFGHR